jgi:hypothetical protein
VRQGTEPQPSACEAVRFWGSGVVKPCAYLLNYNFLTERESEVRGQNLTTSEPHNVKHGHLRFWAVVAQQGGGG